MDILKTYGSIVIAVVTVCVSLVAQWAVFTVRLSNIEGRQDRQTEAIQKLQDSDKSQIAIAATLSAKVDAIADNVNFIRDRIVRVTQ